VVVAAAVAVVVVVAAAEVAAVVVVAAEVVAAAEAHAAGVPAHTHVIKLTLQHKARPDLPVGLFSFRT